MATSVVTETTVKRTVNRSEPVAQTEREVVVTSDHGWTLGNLRDFVAETEKIGLPDSVAVAVEILNKTQTPVRYTATWKTYPDT